MNSSEDRLCRFGEFTLDLTGEELRRDGAPLPLQPQPMTLLRLLVSRPGELVTRKELQDALWGKDTFVDFDQGLNWCIRRLREVLGDDASHPRFIQTVPRKGYRFIAAVNAPAPPPRRRGIAAALVAAACLLVTGHVARDARAVTIVVLPFDNFTGSAQNELAANAATEEVINRVGSLDPRRIRVIDRLTAAKFRRTDECIIHIGQQLGADFVMEGSLQRHHTTAALYRVADNTQVWAVADLSAAGLAAKVEETFR